MFALGCIQAQTCHTGNRPTGVTTQDPVRQHALVVPTKAERVYLFHERTLEAPRRSWSGLPAWTIPARSPHHIVRRIDENNVRLLLANLLPQGRSRRAPQDDLGAEHHIYRHYWK